MKLKTFLLLMLFVICLVLNGRAQESTTVVVRAKAKDAKFIGSSMNGARVTIREINTGKLLAEGVTKGSTGDTEKIVKQPHQRYRDLSSEGAAKFETTLDLSEPTFVTISATAPVSQKQSQVTSSTQLWLIPGRDITGDGIVLEIPGFAIDILQPQAHERSNSDTITITANAVMMCGCPIQPGGMWNSNEMEFTAIVMNKGQEIIRKEMEYAGKPNTFEIRFSPEDEGAYQITVYGYDARTGNTGVDRTTFIKQ